MSETLSIGQVLKAVETTRNTLLQWEELLALKIPRDEKGHRLFDQPWVKYFTTWREHLDLIGCTLPELLAEVRTLDLNLPIDRDGRTFLTRDWARYFETVREKRESGKDTYWLVYNLKTPNQLRPQLAHAYGPDY